MYQTQHFSNCIPLCNSMLHVFCFLFTQQLLFDLTSGDWRAHFYRYLLPVIPDAYWKQNIIIQCQRHGHDVKLHPHFHCHWYTYSFLY